jgi:hypothetical protein
MSVEKSEAQLLTDLRLRAARSHKAGFGEMAVESSAICYIWICARVSDAPN